MAAQSLGKKTLYHGLNPLTIDGRAWSDFDAKMTAQVERLQRRFFEPRRHPRVRIKVFIIPRKVADRDL